MSYTTPDTTPELSKRSHRVKSGVSGDVNGGTPPAIPAPFPAAPPNRAALHAALDLLQTLRAVDSEFPIQYAICLTEIARRERMSVTELAQRTQISLSTVSRIVSALSHRKGRYGHLIEVRFCREEARRKELTLTPKGHEFMSDMTKNLTPKPP